MKLNRLVLFVPDIRKARQFYSEVLVSKLQQWDRLLDWQPGGLVDISRG